MAEVTEERPGEADGTARWHRAAVGVVALCSLACALAYGRDAELARDDLGVLSTLHDFLRGYEVRKDYGHVGWALLHAVGHLDLRLGAWADGRVGGTLAPFAALIVPFCAFVASRLARVVSSHPTAPALAAILTASSPALLVGVGTLGFFLRAWGVGLALLAVVRLVEALRERAASGLLPSLFLFAFAVLVHPFALVGPVIGAPLLLAEAWRGTPGRELDSGDVAAQSAGGTGASAGRARDRRVRVGILGGAGLGMIAIFGALAAWTGQGHRASESAAHFGGALGFMTQVAAAHGVWQLPGLGRLAPLAPGPLMAGLGALAIAGLLAGRSTRAAGLLCLGGLAAALPEAASPYPPRGWEAAWTGNFVKAAVGMELVAPVALAVVVLGLGAPRRRALLLGALLVLSVVRGAPLLVHEPQVVARDAAANRTIGKALAGAATLGVPLLVVGDLTPLSGPAFAARFNPELPPDSSLRRAADKRGGPGPYAGMELVQWRTAAMRCELRLGLSRLDGIVPETPQAAHRSVCQRLPEQGSAARAERARCALVAEAAGDPVRLLCPLGSPPALPSRSRDPTMWRWLGLLAFLSGGALLALRRGPNSGIPAPRSRPARLW